MRDLLAVRWILVIVGAVGGLVYWMLDGLAPGVQLAVVLLLFIGAVLLLAIFLRRGRRPPQH